MRQTGSKCWEGPYCSKNFPCGTCDLCNEHKNKITTVEDDGEITLYETSLGYEPYKD